MPLPDEHAASWLCRMLWANGLPTGDPAVLCDLFGVAVTWDKLDFGLPAPLRTTLAIVQPQLSRHGTAFSVAAVSDTDMDEPDLAGRPQEIMRLAPLLVSASHGWLADLRISAASGRWRAPGFAFCPACLAEDAVPYLRRHWRLALRSTCTRHRVMLRVDCPRCTALFLPWAHSWPNLPASSIPAQALLTACRRCGGDLADAAAAPATNEVLAFEDTVTAALLATQRTGLTSSDGAALARELQHVHDRAARHYANYAFATLRPDTRAGAVVHGLIAIDNACARGRLGRHYLAAAAATEKRRAVFAEVRWLAATYGQPPFPYARYWAERDGLAISDPEELPAPSPSGADDFRRFAATVLADPWTPRDRPERLARHLMRAAQRDPVVVSRMNEWSANFWQAADASSDQPAPMP